MTDPGISWHVQTHNDRERSPDWYWGVGLITLAAAGLCIFLSNLLLGAILIIAAGTVMVMVARGPREHEVNFTPRGVSLDGTLYRWESVRSFWVSREYVLLSTQALMHPQIVLPLVDLSRAQAVRAYCKRFCTEEEQQPHVGHHVVEMLGL